MSTAARNTILGVLILGVGFAGGWLVGHRGGRTAVGPADPAAKEALAELLSYCGQGPKAVRRVYDLVRAAAAGGSALLPAVREALSTSAPWTYDLSSWSFDPRAAELSVLPTRRAALVEVAARIGGDGAVEILREQAVRSPEWLDRVTGALFLGRFADRGDVRAFYMERLRAILESRKGDPEATQTLRIMRGRLPAEAFDVLARAFAAGWAPESMAEELAACLVALDREKAAELFLRTLSDPDAPAMARIAAAASAARLPERRPAAGAVILRERERGFARAFVGGLRLGRFDEVDRYRDAFESGDPEVFRAYNEERLADMASARQILGEFSAAMGEAEAEVIGIPKLLKEFDAAMEDARDRQRLIDQQRPR
jgi:hypothetical protein